MDFVLDYTAEQVNKSIGTGWEGKKIGTFGDSLVMMQAWHSYVRDALNCTTSATGLSGGTVGDNGIGNGAYLRSNTDEIPVDIDSLIILAGANDVLSDAYLIGDVTDLALTDAQLAAQEEPETFCQAYNTMLLNIHKRFPEIRPFICTQTQYFGSYWGGGNEMTPNSDIKASKIRELAQFWGYPLIDLWRESGINFRTKNIFLANEDIGRLWVHYNTAGGKRVAGVISGRLLELSPEVYEVSDYGAPETFA